MMSTQGPAACHVPSTYLWQSNGGCTARVGTSKAGDVGQSFLDRLRIWYGIIAVGIVCYLALNLVGSSADAPTHAGGGFDSI
eukprot:11603447-Karenia_brevis.AAC.1